MTAILRSGVVFPLLSQNDFSLKLTLFLGGLVVLLVALALLVRWWGRLYQEKDGDEGSPLRRVLKNSVTLAAARLVGRVIDIAFLIVVLHYLGDAGYGHYEIAVVVVGLYLTTVTGFGLDLLTTREVARYPEQANRYLANTTVVRWLLSALALPAVAILITIYRFTPHPLQLPAIAALWLLTISLFPANLAAGVSSIFFARERMEIPALAALLLNVLKVFAGVWVLAAGWGVVGLAASALGLTIVNAILFLYLQRQLLFRPRFEFDPSFCRWMVRESFPLMLNSLLQQVFFRFDTLIMQPYHGDTGVGTYGAGTKLPYALTEIPYFLLMPLLPRLSRYAVEDRERLVPTYALALKLLLLLALPAALTISILSTEIIWVVGGVKFLPGSAVTLAIIVWFLPLSYVNGVTQYVLIALNRQKTITVAFAIAAVFNVVTNLIWIPHYGYTAASIITILTEVVLLIPFWIIVRREIGRLPLWQVAWRPLLATAVMGVPMFWLHARGYWAVALVAGAALYVGMLFALRVFTPEEWGVLSKMLPGRKRGEVARDM